MVAFKRISASEFEGETFDDWLKEENDYYRAREGKDFNDDQIEWMRLIWEEYNDDGEINWDKNHYGAWWYYMTEVLGYDEETVERYVED
jgi:hypothetical protein